LSKPGIVKFQELFAKKNITVVQKSEEMFKMAGVKLEFFSEEVQQYEKQ